MSGQRLKSQITTYSKSGQQARSHPVASFLDLVGLYLDRTRGGTPEAVAAIEGIVRPEVARTRWE